MSASLFFLILFSAFLHAFWNVLVKGGDDPLFGTGLIALGAFFCGVVGAAFFPFPPLAVWPYLLLSTLLHDLYLVFVARSYARIDLSFCYPLMRGLAPLCTSLLLLFLGTPFHKLQLVGIFVLSLGILLLALGRGQERRGLLYPVLTALFIMSYTVTDGLGARAWEPGFAYACWVFILQPIPLLAYFLLRCHASFFRYLWKNPNQVAGGIGSFISYSIVLFAMTKAPIAAVAALRETSVLFGLLLAVLFLHERFTVVRFVSVLLVVGGAMLLKLA